MNIIKSFDAAFKRMKEKNWDYIYVLVDIHGTIFKPSYNEEEEFKLYPYAEDALKLMSDNPKIKIILWSSSKRIWMNEYSRALVMHNIFVDYLNCNPEVTVQDGDPEQLSFHNKFYFNVGIDDKFGFEPETDWELLYNYLKEKFAE